MATTIQDGAIYGSGIFGVNRYGVLSLTQIVDGYEIAASVDSFTVSADASTEVTGYTLSPDVGSFGVIGTAEILVNGVASTSVVGYVIVLENELLLLTGLGAFILLGNPNIINISFNYEAIKEQYERERTVYVEARVQESRTVYVGNQHRQVYVES